MKYTTYEPQQNVYETRIKPSNLDETQWNIWLEFNRGLSMKEIGKIYGKAIHQVNKVFDECVYALRVEPAVFEPCIEPSSWQEAFSRKLRIRAKFEAAPIVNGCKLVISEL